MQNMQNLFSLPFTTLINISLREHDRITQDGATL
jgi:hypothetical protein